MKRTTAAGVVAGRAVRLYSTELRIRAALGNMTFTLTPWWSLEVRLLPPSWRPIDPQGQEPDRRDKFGTHLAGKLAPMFGEATQGIHDEKLGALNVGASDHLSGGAVRWQGRNQRCE